MRAITVVLLALHIIAGTLAIIAGSVPLVTAKGSRRHRNFSRWFIRFMFVVLGTATILTAIRLDAYFAGLTASAAIVVLSGWRVLRRNRAHRNAAACDRGTVRSRLNPLMVQAMSRMLRIAPLWLALPVASTALAQAPQDVPQPPDCSAVPANPPARLDCGTLARIDMAASEMVASGYTPGLVVAIMRGNRFVFARGYGVANIEAGLAATPTSVFPIYSITKVFTASAIMQLRDAGKLQISDRLSKYIPWFPSADSITLAQLLSHTSGIHDVDFDLAGRVSSDSLVRMLAAQPRVFDFAPGSADAYSNAGYTVLGRIVEIVSGRPFRLYVRDSLVAKVPFLGIAVDQQTDIVPGRAGTYLRTTIPGRFANGPFVDPSVRFSTGSIRSDILDLGVWFNAFFEDRIVSNRSRTEMMTRAHTQNGRLTGGDWGGFGYGLEVANCSGHPYVGHGGATSAGNMLVHNYLDDGFMLIIFANTSHTAMQLEPRIIREIYGADHAKGSCN